MSQTTSTRLAGVGLVAALLWYVPWMLTSANPNAIWLAVPFIIGNLILGASMIVTVVNRWSRKSLKPVLAPAGTEPLVGVIIPTAGEPPQLVRRTIESVLAQDWPGDRLWIVVSDDVGQEAIERTARSLDALHPLTRITYHRPAARDSAERRGEAKAGNLNSALELMRMSEEKVRFIETRDADDEVADPRFLRECIGQLQADSRAAYVQTIKSGTVSPGDPFDNNQPHFFRAALPTRMAANAVFPCGSGLVWREAALVDIGDFPDWNLVEDLQSGIEALRRGWKGLYLPIVGAHGQHSPQDIPNTYKQRGTWALDATRLLVWGNLKGLSVRQKLQFYELGFFYLQSVAVLIFAVMPVFGFVFDIYPLQTDIAEYLLRFWPFAVMLEVYLAVSSRPASLEDMWRARCMWVGLAPVFAKAFVLAIIGGRSNKPLYKVTRKTDEHAWYWRETLVQMTMLFALVGSVAYALSRPDIVLRFDIGTAYWTLLYSAFLVGFIRLGWFGTRTPLARLVGRVRSVRWALPATSLAASLLLLVASSTLVLG